MESGLIVSSNNLLSNYNIDEKINFVFIRVGFTDYNKNKTKCSDKSFYDNYIYAKEKNLKIGVYYESCATNIEEAQNEINYFLDLIKNVNINYYIIIQYEDDHNTTIYHPLNQNKIRKETLIKIATLQVDELKKNGYEPIIKTYELWYKNIFKNSIENIKYFLDNNIDYFYDIFYIKENTVINSLCNKKTTIEILVKENNIFYKIKNYLKAGYKYIKRKIGK